MTRRLDVFLWAMLAVAYVAFLLGVVPFGYCRARDATPEHEHKPYPKAEDPNLWVPYPLKFTPTTSAGFVKIDGRWRAVRDGRIVSGDREFGSCVDALAQCRAELTQCGDRFGALESETERQVLEAQRNAREAEAVSRSMADDNAGLRNDNMLLREKCR